MNYNNLTKQLKELIAEFVTPAGEILEEPAGRYYGRKQLDGRRLKILRIFVDFLINTGFLREPTKYYIRSKYMSIEGVAAYLRSKGRDICYSTTQSIIWFDMDRLSAKLSKRILVDIVEYNAGIDEYEQKLIKLLAAQTNGHMLGNLALEIPEPIMATEASEEEFQDFVQAIAPFSPQHMAFVSQNIPAEMWGYAKYILSSSTLSGEEQERKELLLRILSKDASLWSYNHELE